jgi:hypothetical protein
MPTCNLPTWNSPTACPPSTWGGLRAVLLCHQEGVGGVLSPGTALQPRNRCPPMAVRAVIDANVLVRGLLAAEGPPRQVLSLGETRAIQALTPRPFLELIAQP